MRCIGSAEKPRPFDGPRPGRASAPGPSRGRGLLAPEAPRPARRAGRPFASQTLLALIETFSHGWHSEGPGGGRSSIYGHLVSPQSHCCPAGTPPHGDPRAVASSLSRLQRLPGAERPEDACGAPGYLRLKSLDSPCGSTAALRAAVPSPRARSARRALPRPAKGRCRMHKERRREGNRTSWWVRKEAGWSWWERKKRY